MKKAFTMIELIFVIVILGILAAVALPKFLGVANQAHEANLKAFVGTLNRTVGPTLWSEAISKGDDGNVTVLEVNLSSYTDIPKEIGTDINISNCSSDTSKYRVISIADKAKAGDNYAIACRTGNSNEAPKFVLVKGKTETTFDGSDIGKDEANSANVDVSIGQEINWTGNGATDESILVQK